MNMLSNKYLTLALSILLIGCKATDRPVPVDTKILLSDIQRDAELRQHMSPPSELPSNIQHEISNVDVQRYFQSHSYAQKRFDVSANDVDASIFFASLVEGMDLSAVVHSSVKGKITLSLKSVTLLEVLSVVEDMFGYDITLEKNILRVFPARMRTETFTLNYLFMERNGKSITSVSAGRLSDQQGGGGGGDSGGGAGSANGTFISSETNTNFWDELQQTLESIIGNFDADKGHSVIVSPQAGLVTVRAFPVELKEIKLFLKTAENHLQRQVVLEAKVLEVKLSTNYQQGIQWSDIVGSIGSTDILFGTSSGVFSDPISGALGGVTAINISGNDFTSVINLLNSQGDVDVLSSPRVTASNNQKAVIKVGKDEYFVTNVSSTTVASSTPVTTPDVELTPFFSGIALDVTPQIDKSGNVQLHIHPSVIEVKEQLKQIKVSNSTLELPLAQSEIRESDTIIKAKSGDVVIIGGLMKTENLEQVSNVPFLSSIPIIGEVFKSRTQYKEKTELVIMLKPTVVGTGTWKDELEKTKRLLDKWYPTKTEHGFTDQQ